MALKTFCRRLFIIFVLTLPSSALGAEGANEVVAVIVAPNSPERQLDKAGLGGIFLRKTLLWSNGEAIKPVNLPANHWVRRLFSERVLGVDPVDLEDYWNDQYFHGVFPPYAVASEEAAIRYVADSPDAIGYVSACLLDNRVKPVLYVKASGISPVTNSLPHCQPNH